MRRLPIRIGLSFAVIFIVEAAVAIASATTLEAFRLWIGVTSVLILTGAVLVRFAGPAGRLSDLQVGNFMVSSGTRPLWDMSRPLRSPTSHGGFAVALGTGLVFGVAYLLMLSLPGL